MGASAELCVNHTERNSLGRCTRCRHPFCDGCLAFSVDGSPWCEPCGNALVDEVRPRWVLGALALAAGFGFTTAAWIAKAVFVPYRVPYFLVVIFLAYAGSLLGAWRLTMDATVGERPRIERRRS
jgi:hypothetical protein